MRRLAAFILFALTIAWPGPLAVTFNRGAPDRFYHSDAQGSRLAFSNSAGVVGARERYAPFGESLLNGAGMGNFITYTGHMRDVDTGLTYMQARFYDPVIGRFLSTDPIGYQDQLNLYAYVANDPVNKVDPTGEQTAGIVQMINRINEALTPASQSGAPPATPLSPAPTPELVLPAGTVQVGVTGQVTVPGGFQVQGSLGVAISGAPDAAIVATGSAGPTSDVNGSVSVGGEVISSNAPSVMNLAGPGSAASYTGGNGVEGITGTGGRSDDGTVMTGGAAISIGVSREPSVGAARTETAVMPITPIDDERQRQ